MLNTLGRGCFQTLDWAKITTPHLHATAYCPVGVGWHGTKRLACRRMSSSHMPGLGESRLQENGLREHERLIEDLGFPPARGGGRGLRDLSVAMVLLPIQLNRTSIHILAAVSVHMRSAEDLGVSASSEGAKGERESWP